MTHKDIAKIANVSVSTVSKALSGSKEISSELAEEIQRIAVETGYFKEKSRRKLEYLKDKQPLIAVVCPEIISVFYSKMITCIKREVEERGGRIAVYIYDFSNAKLQNINDNLTLSKEVDGIITFSSWKVNIIPDIPVVRVGYHGSAWCDAVYIDLKEVMQDVIEHLMELGHSKIGFVGEIRTKSKMRLFKEILLENNIQPNEEYIYTIDERFEKIGETAAKLIAEKKDIPTAFVTAYDEVALGLVYGLKKHGFKVPEDISVVGMNDIPHARYAQPQPTTVDMAYDEQSRIAVSMVYDKIFRGERKNKSVKVGHKLIVRGTTDKAPDMNDKT